MIKNHKNVRVRFGSLNNLLMLFSFVFVLSSCTEEISVEPTEISSPQSAASYSNNDVIALQAVVNSQFVCAENGGSSPLIANRGGADGAWEKFIITNNSDGTVSFQSLANNKFVCADRDYSGTSWTLIANRDNVGGSWEKFDLINNSDGTISLFSRGNSQYVCAENGGSSNLIANRGGIGLWEKFNFINLDDDGGTTDPGCSTAACIIGSGWKLNGYTGNLNVNNSDNGLDYEDDASTSESHFFFEKDGFAAFRCYPGNPTSSSNTSNPRTELREIINGGDNYWNGNTNTEHSMKWRFKIENLPPSGKLAFGQIHEEDDFYDDVIRVQVQGDAGQGSGDVDLRILGYVTEDVEDMEGRTVDFDMQLDTEYYFELTMSNGVVTLYDLNNSGNRVEELFKSIDIGNANENYFKAGCYLQSTSSSHYGSSDYGQVLVKDLTVSPDN